MAVARLERIEDDPQNPDFFHAFVSERQEPAKAAPLKRTNGIRNRTPETRRNDKSRHSTAVGKNNRGCRLLCILRAGIVNAATEFDHLDATTGDVAMEYGRPVVEEILRCPVRDAGLCSAALNAYDSTCAFTGLRIPLARFMSGRRLEGGVQMTGFGEEAAKTAVSTRRIRSFPRL